jgi:hypothetical protein
VHASKGRWKTHGTCSIITEHNCFFEAVAKTHRIMAYAFVADKMYGLIFDKLVYEANMITRHSQRTYQYTISYTKAWRAKQKVFKMRFSTYEDSYGNMSCILCKILERNPRSYFDVLHFPNPMGGPSIFHIYIFRWSLPEGISVLSLNHLYL